MEHAKRNFNHRLSIARRDNENTFGISTARWHIFKRPIDAIPERGIGITKAVVALHKFLMLLESLKISNDGNEFTTDGLSTSKRLDF